LEIDEVNPFYLSPVREAAVFAGRGQELSYLNGLLRDSRHGVFRHGIIMGKPGLGKTSLLNMFKIMAKERGDAIVAHLDLYKTFARGGDALDIFRGLEIEMLNQLRKIDPSLLSYSEDVFRRFTGTETGMLSTGSKVTLQMGLPTVGALTIEHALKRGAFSPLSLVLRSDFEELEKRAKQKGVKGIFILIDDGHSINEIAEGRSVLQLLKNTFQSQEGYSMLVFGDMTTLRGFQSLHEGFTDIFERVKIEQMNAGDALDLIKHRLDWASKRGGVAKFEEQAAQQIVRKAGGNPRRIVRYCCEAVEEARKGNHRVTLSLVKSLRISL
jgi:hypothetical protein